MKISPMLSRILSESLLVAKDYNHQFFTPEHVLATAINFEFVENIILAPFIFKFLSFFKNTLSIIDTKDMIDNVQS